MRHLNRRHALLAAAATAWPWRAEAGGEVVDETWHDAARSRSLPLRLRLSGGPGPWPVVLYSHGLGGSREGGDAWGEAWRSAGVAVVHLQHPGSDAALLGRVVAGGLGLAGLRSAANAEQLLARVADVHFVLDEIGRRQRAGQSPWRDARLDAIGLAGHSFGAVTTQAIAGQRYAVAVDLADARPRAFVALSPSMPRAGALAPAAPFAGITRPFLALTGSQDADPFGAFTDGAARAAVYDGLPRGQRALLWLDGADHMSFAGNAARPIAGRGPFQRAEQALQREAAHHALAARVTTLWWRARLMDDRTALAELARLEALGLGEGDRLTLG